MWSKKPIRFRIGKTVYYSIVFTWDILPVLDMIKAEPSSVKVVCGGPAVLAMPEYFEKYRGALPGDISPLAFHNPLATFTSRGCPRRCKFCTVPNIEGEIKEQKVWPVLPIVCDNNFLACSEKHIENAITKLCKLPLVDFNQGLDARLVNDDNAKQLGRLPKLKARLALDSVKSRSVVAAAVEKLRQNNIQDISIYSLVGHRDNISEALGQMRFIRDELKAIPLPMRYQPLNALRYNGFVDPAWKSHELKNFIRYWFRQSWFGGVDYENYRGVSLPYESQDVLAL